MLPASSRKKRKTRNEKSYYLSHHPYTDQSARRWVATQLHKLKLIGYCICPECSTLDNGTTQGNISYCQEKDIRRALLSNTFPPRLFSQEEYKNFVNGSQSRGKVQCSDCNRLFHQNMSVTGTDRNEYETDDELDYGELSDCTRLFHQDMLTMNTDRIVYKKDDEMFCGEFPKIFNGEMGNDPRTSSENLDGNHNNVFNPFLIPLLPTPPPPPPSMEPTYTPNSQEFSESFITEFNKNQLDNDTSLPYMYEIMEEERFNSHRKTSDIPTVDSEVLQPCNLKLPDFKNSFGFMGGRDEGFDLSI